MSPEEAAKAALRAALAEEREVTLSDAALDQLLENPANGSIVRFHLLGDGARCVSSAVLARWAEANLGLGARGGIASVMLLTHTFAGLPDTLRLTTAIVSDVATRGHAAAALCESAFGAGLHVALKREGSNGWVHTDVTLKGISQDTNALAAWQKPHRVALRSAQRMQLIAALDASIDMKLGDGFLLLKDAAKQVLPSLAGALDALTLHVSHDAADNTADLTHRAMLMRTMHAEQLEARGEYIAAAEIYKRMLCDVKRNPSLHLVDSPPLVWSYYGIALKRAGHLVQADAAYEAGLRELRTCRMLPDTPQVRDSARLDLLSHLVYLHLYTKTAKEDAAVERLFCAQINELVLSGERSYAVECINDQLVLIGHTTRRRFALESLHEHDHTGKPLNLMRIVELPRSWQPTGPKAGGDSDLRMARATVELSSGPPKLPQLPRGRCAACGNEATKRCAACNGPFYCGAACQKLHWKDHRAACKAATKGGAGK